MNRGLLWGLGATTAVSAWVVLNPSPPSNPVASAIVVAAGKRVSGDGASTPRPSVTRDEASATAESGLPEHWPQPNVDSAPRNPFLPMPPPAIQPVIVEALSPPAAPPTVVSDYRFWGRITVAEGERLTYIARGESGSPVAIELGTRLEGGWSVDAVGDNAIVLLQASSQQRSTMSIPPHGPAGQP